MYSSEDLEHFRQEKSKASLLEQFCSSNKELYNISECRV